MHLRHKCRRVYRAIRESPLRCTGLSPTSIQKYPNSDWGWDISALVSCCDARVASSATGGAPLAPQTRTSFEFDGQQYKNMGYPNGVSHILVLVTGLEPVRLLQQGILSPWCLPIPPHQHICSNNTNILFPFRQATKGEFSKYLQHTFQNFRKFFRVIAEIGSAGSFQSLPITEAPKHTQTFYTQIFSSLNIRLTIALPL